MNGRSKRYREADRKVERKACVVCRMDMQLEFISSSGCRGFEERHLE